MSKLADFYMLSEEQQNVILNLIEQFIELKYGVEEISDEDVRELLDDEDEDCIKLDVDAKLKELEAKNA